MNQNEINKVRNFLGDKEMQQTVKSVLIGNFMSKRSDADVHTLAAQTLAVQFVEDAWREMERYKQEPKKNVDKDTSHI